MLLVIRNIADVGLLLEKEPTALYLCSVLKIQSIQARWLDGLRVLLKKPELMLHNVFLLLIIQVER